MKPVFVTCLGALSLTIGSLLFGADTIPSKSTYAQRYGETKTPVAVDPARDLPRYPAVEPKDAIATWHMKKGFRLELAAHEPQVRDPIAICFDENGRMFVCEMIDYSEMRDVTPHLGRVSMLEDKDADGYFETSTVFADDLAWPTGLIWAKGGLFVGATPDIWFFKDSDGDGKADIREKVFTGFGTGLKMLNVQGLMNSFQWGLDNRIHILAGGGNRGVVTCAKRPDLKGIELGGKDFWFDPRTFEFGLEGGGAQYGMSFDNYGRKFGCSNSDHLQYWVYDDRYAGRNPYFQMPPARQSIAVDGGAAEVFRISPDEPWRIIRTRWRIAGVVKGVVEGGGRVSGYFTGATGTTIYRGDAYGPEFVNNSFTGDAGGQLVHRKIIRPAPDGISLIGERPADERGFEFAASKDTWVRVVNFANTPDGCLYICDMYREVIEHPWSIPDEIKKHLDLNSGNDRGRIYRIVPDQIHPSYPPDPSNQKTLRRHPPALAKASTAELVKTLAHPNGWHRDTAQRLLYERQDKAAVPMLKKVISGDHALAKLHALALIEDHRGMNDQWILRLLKDSDEHVRERGIVAVERLGTSGGQVSPALQEQLGSLARDKSMRVRCQLALTAGTLAPLSKQPLSQNPNTKLLAALLFSEMPDAIRANVNAKPIPDSLLKAVASAPPDVAWEVLLRFRTICPAGLRSYQDAVAPLIKSGFASAREGEMTQRVSAIVSPESFLPASWIKAILEGLRSSADTKSLIESNFALNSAISEAAATASATKSSEPDRLEAILLLQFVPLDLSFPALAACLAKGQPDAIQAAALQTLARHSSAATTTLLLDHWPDYGPKTKAAALDAFLARDDRALALLNATVVKPADLSASQVQAMVHHKNAKVAALAKTVLASVIPPSREEVIAKFKPALSTKGDAKRGEAHFVARCIACHRANGQGIQVGPDLVTVKTKGREALLTAILEPHKEVAPQFIAYTVNTKDGQSLSGIVINDDASSMTIKLMGGAAMTFPRSNIKGTSSAGQSLMPEGLEQGMDVQAMADLLDFIEAVK